MARGSEQAKTAATTAQNMSTGFNSNANQLYGTVAPELTQQLRNPTGLTPTEKSNMTTAGMQTAGGAMSGAVGQGALQAARTRNAGGADAAIQESARNAGQANGNTALKTEMADASLKEKNRQGALAGLGGLLGGQTQASIGALGQVAPNVNADVNAQNASWNWAKYILDPAMQAAGGAAGGGAFK